MSDVLESTEPGWRRDPSGRFEWRYFDGGWTNRVASSTPDGPVPTSPTTAEPTEAPVDEIDAAFAFGPLPDPTAPTSPPSPAPQAPPTPQAAPTPAPPTPRMPETPQATSPAPAAVAPAAVAPAPIAPEPEVTDPFAALRAPRTEASPEPAPVAPAPAPAPAPVPAPAPASGPAPTLAAAPPPAPVPSSLVPTIPTLHDGSSGTVWDAPYVPPGTPPERDPSDRNIAAKSVGGILGFIRSFWEQDESYHSPKAGAALPPHPRSNQLAPPPNYARAGLVMLAACGVAIGAYLPWMAGTIGGTPFERTGYQLGNAWGFTWAAAAFAIAALLATRRKVMGWVTMGASVVVAGLVARQLLLVHDQVQGLNSRALADVNVGVGLWIMLASAAIGLVAAFRFDGTQSTI